MIMVGTDENPDPRKRYRYVVESNRGMYGVVRYEGPSVFASSAIIGMWRDEYTADRIALLLNESVGHQA
jgi:hypothetical protein